jgi:outer membrane protein OmpA-like peptidoglycan-associated protein
MVSSGALVTPRLPSGPLPPLAKGAMPHLQPSKAFDSPPEASALPPQAAPSALDTPNSAPDLPSDDQPVPPPPNRDAYKSSPALKPAPNDAKGDTTPGNRFVLDSDVSIVTFGHLAENVADDQLPVLDKLANILRSSNGLRITLTAYAQSSGNVSPRDARRLSLTRALVVRDYLTAKGVSSGRIDVRALGVNYTGDNGDRVDITAN